MKTATERERAPYKRSRKVLKGNPTFTSLTANREEATKAAEEVSAVSEVVGKSEKCDTQ